MGKYTNASFYQKTYSNNHDCANDGTCGQSIIDFRIGGSDILFYDHYGRMIAQMPKLPMYSSDKHGHQLYKAVESKQFNSLPSIYDVLPNSFNVKYEHINYTIKHESLSQQEQDQIKMDIINAYDTFKKMFCINSFSGEKNIKIHVFNNHNDFIRYGPLVSPIFNPDKNTYGITDVLKNIICFKTQGMDFILGHELGHMFQYQLAPASAVRNLETMDTEFLANAIGREVEEKNHKVILKQKEAILEQKGVEEYWEFYGEFGFQYKGVTYEITHKNLSEEEKDQMIKDIKNSHELLISEYHKLSQSRNTTVVIEIDIDEDKNIEDIYCQKPGDLYVVSLDKDLISKSKSKEEAEESHEVEQTSQEEEPSEIESGFDSVFSFEYKRASYCVCQKNLSEEEKDQIIQDIKNSHELLISEYHKLWGVPSNKNAYVIIDIDSDKNVEKVILFESVESIGSSNFVLVDTALINRNKSDSVDSSSSEETIEEENGQEQANQSTEVAEEQGKSELNNDEKEIDSTNPDSSINQTSSFVDILTIPFSLFASLCSDFMSWLFGSNEEETIEKPIQLNDNTPLRLDQVIEEEGQSRHIESVTYDYSHSSNDLL